VWITENTNALGGIDVRRFVSFGVIKGFLYRVHRYPILGESANGDKKPYEKRRQALKYVALYLEFVDNPRRLDGRKHTDALCTLLECSIQDVEDQLAEFDNLQWIWR
jgi:hypothetical protein